MSHPQIDVLAVAMRLLATREHSASELRKKLVQKGHDVREVVEVLEQLRDENLQSDERFVECFINSRRERGKGPLHIQRELQQYEINSELINAYLDVRDPVWLNRASTVREKKFGKTLPDDFKEKMRQLKFLEYRGFSHEQIRSLFGDAD
jgi:regulatory protein